MSRGYPAFVLEPGTGAPAMYRVRVGGYKERREADKVARRLKQEEQLNPWITR
jgi:cell division protein FtsN